MSAGEGGALSNFMVGAATLLGALLLLSNSSAAQETHSLVDWEPFVFIERPDGDGDEAMVALFSSQAWPMRGVVVGLGCYRTEEAVILGSEIGLYQDVVSVAYRFEGRGEVSVDMQTRYDQYVGTTHPRVLAHFHEGFRNTTDLWFQVHDLPVAHVPLVDAASNLDRYIEACRILQTKLEQEKDIDDSE